MSNRSAKFVAALFASILTAASFTSVTNVRAQAAADNCLTAPKDKTPAGSHWYYRLERGTKRQCWYLRDENDKSARAAPQDSTDEAAADPAPPPARPAVRKSVANAHAELTSAQQRVEQEPAAVAEPRTVGMAPAPAFQNSPFQNSPAAIAPDTTMSSSTVATRWPDSSGMSSSNTLRTAAAEPEAAPPDNSQAAPPPAPAPVALAAADSSMAKQPASMQMLFLVMAGALALAGITASLVYRFGRARARARHREIRRERRAIWDSIHHERPSPSMLPDEDVPMWRRDEPHDPRAPDDPQRRVTEMLSRLARSAQN
ncbi:hypothetical protein [Afipia sp. GAS231]|uniref:hypothetical protein n=1 Tax=Afipia sp. GAS231 TaxID=1882747 RepID=UPI00087A4178|nr:hypothetical protein [Afipia sp. GAS231]SDP40499.1 hypothetical protein SAMN05444050_6745 [Afipia sp. GAS231]